MTDPERGKSAAELAVKVLELALSAAFLYCALRPSALGELEDRIAHARARLADRIVVWEQRREIRALPEVDG